MRYAPSGLASMCACVVLSSCQPTSRSGIDLTLIFDDSVSDAALASMTRLAFTAQGDESGEFDLAAPRALARSERLVYRPATMTHQLTLVIAGLTDDGSVLAVGESGALLVPPHGDLAATITLHDDANPTDDGAMPFDATPLPDLPPPDGAFFTCSNAITDGDEVGLDCGGSCLSCIGTPCNSDADCVSGNCDVICSPASGPPSWVVGPSLGAARAYLGAAQRPDGTVVVAAGTSNGSQSGAVGTVEILGRVGFSTAPSLMTARYAAGAAADPNGIVYVVGGEDVTMTALTSVEKLAPSGSAWTAAQAMPSVHAFMTVAPLDADRLLLTDSTPCIAYRISTNSWASVSSPVTLRDSQAEVRSAEGKVYDIGGHISGGAVANVDAYDATANTWTARAALPTKRRELGGALGADGRIYAVGGFDAIALATVEAYQVGADHWSGKVAQLRAPRWAHAVAPGPDGRIYAIGGLDSTSKTLATSEAYGPIIDVMSPVVSTGGNLVIGLSNFAASAAGHVQIDSTMVGTFVTDASGAASKTVQVPLTLGSGPHVITAIDVRSHYPVTAVFNVP